ncbi:MAG TPA: FUSC family protein [Polyangiales bacterium]|nr:FUSC family protein [Polyangiales bacterium]
MDESELSRPFFQQIRNSAIRREALRVTGKPNLAAGLRAGLATTAPLLLAVFWPRPELAFASLAGFTVVLSDKGGAYRSRAKAMLSLTLGGGLATLLGMLAAVHPLLSVGLVVIVVGLAGFLRLFGAEATSVGISVAMTLVIALTRPADSPLAALLCATFSVAGGLWACAISLVLWPLRVFKPARRAIAAALRELGGVARSLIDASPEPRAQVSRREQLGRARNAIELARAQLGALRKGRLGPSQRGELLVALVEAADLLLGALVAIEDSLAFAPPRDLPELPRWIKGVAEHTSSELARVAEALEAERALPPRAAGVQPFATTLRSAADSPSHHQPRILARALERIDRLAELARAVDDPDAEPVRASRAEPSDLSSQASKLSLIRDNFTLDSAMFKHTLRTMLAVAATVLVVQVLELDHGYWATLTCLVIMQPHGTQTWAKAMQRVVGSVLGAGLALAIASWVAEPLALMACVFGFVALAVTLLPLNYGAFTVFLTPGFVLLAETNHGDTDLAGIRVLNTLLGASIALLGSRLLFPVSERDSIRPLMAAALAELGKLTLLASEDPPAIGRVRAARRALGIALLNAEASYQRLLTETGIPAEQSEALLTLLLYAHRMASGLIAIAFAGGTALHARLRERAAELARAIAELEQTVAERRDPTAPLPAAVANAPAERVEALFEQLAILRAAALRFRV